MSIIESVLLYLRRHIVSTIIISSIIAVILLGEIVGYGLYTTAMEGKAYAFKYNGFALGFSDEKLHLTDDDYAAIRQIEHVTGVGGYFSEFTVTPDNMSNVKEHTGVTPAKSEVAAGENAPGDQMLLVAIMDIPTYDIFRSEKSVSIIDGTYPDEKNGGVLIESRFAELNNISVGDEISFYIDELDKHISVMVSGIFYVDTEFEILDTNPYGDEAYLYSPFNHIYIEYMYAGRLIDYDPYVEKGCSVYVDSIDNVSYVTDELRKIIGNDIKIIDNTTNYLERGNGIIGILGGLSKIICVLTIILGSILILIVFSFFFNSYKRDVGIYMAFGESRGRCLGRYMATLFSYTIIGACIFGIVCLVFSGLIIDFVNGQITGTVFGRSVGGAVNEIYRMSNYRKPFCVSIEKDYIFNGSNFIKLFGSWICCFAVSCVIPVFSVFKSSPKQLMNSKE